MDWEKVYIVLLTAFIAVALSHDENQENEVITDTEIVKAVVEVRHRY
jgi:hypothetical protein